VRSTTRDDVGSNPNPTRPIAEVIAAAVAPGFLAAQRRRWRSRRLRRWP
jgi:hypothetical protein